ncbi:amino acid permease, partial [Amycolatopsis sp. NPDC000673]
MADRITGQGQGNPDTPGEATPNEAAAGTTTPREGTAGEAVPAEAADRTVAPGDATPGGATAGTTPPGKAATSKAVPAEATERTAAPGEATPSEATAGTTTPGDGTAGKAVPAEETERTAIPPEAAPRTTTPADATRGKTAWAASETASAETTPPESKAGPKKLRSRHITMIALGGIIGASLFVGSGNVVRAVGPAAVISYLIGGLLVFLAMRMLGEMAAARPAIGSFMEYARVGLGEWAGYLVGWLYWYYWIGVIAFEAVVGGSVLGGWFPDVPQWVFSVVLLLFFTTTNLVSARSFGEVEYWLASIKVAAIIVFLAVGTLFAFGLWPKASFSIPNLWQHGGFAPNGWWPILSGVAIVIFSYFGTEIAVMAAAESEDPAKGVRQAVSTVIWRILLFFVGGVLLIVTIVPWNQLP